MEKMPVYKVLSGRLNQLNNCKKSNNSEWQEIAKNRIEAIMTQIAPSGSGIDSGTEFDFDSSMPDELYLRTAFNHIKPNGFYDGWTEHKIVVTPSLYTDIDIRITGPNRNGIKEYLHEVYHNFLFQLIDY